MSIETITLPIDVNVYTTTKMSSVLGIHSELSQTGLLLDKTLITSTTIEKYNYNTFTGGFDFKLKDGTLITDWQSGVVESISLKSIKADYTPIVNVGTFSLSSSIRNLYSDFSFCDKIISDYNVENKNTYPLPENYILSSVMLSKYKRSTRLLPEIVIEPIYVTEFSENTYSAEYLIEDDILYLNNNFVTKHGFEPQTVDYDFISSNCILLGNGTDNPKDFYTKYFPIISSTIKLYILSSDLSIEEWEVVDNFNYSLSTDKHIVINSDLGIVSCGGYTYDSLVLKEDINSGDTEIEFYTTKDINDYPLIGIIKLNDEYIAYTDRSHNKFLGCFRGYNSTTASSHSLGSVISFEQRGQAISTNASLYAFYESTLRFECEISDYKMRKADVSVLPSKHSLASKILQISSKFLDLDRIVLESDLSLIGSNTYGYLYFGNSISKLTATAYDSFDNPLEDLEITIEIIDPVIGILDGEFSEISKFTNSEGKIFVYYNTPIDQDDFTIKFNSVAYDGTDTVFEIENLSPYISLNDVYLFQIFKHDPSVGSVGVKYNVLSYSNTTTRSGADRVIVIDGDVGELYNNGTAYIASSGGHFITRPISQSDGNTIYLSGPAISFTPVSCYLVTSEDSDWSSENLNGSNVLVYLWDDNSEHPITGSQGAYAPIRPEQISGSEIRYNYTLPQSNPNSRSSNLGGYLIATPIQVGFRAKATDPYTGEIVYSNIVYIVVKFPNYIIGVDSSGTLPVPKGFNFIVDEENVGTGLGLPNFITINSKGGIYGLQLKFNS